MNIPAGPAELTNEWLTKALRSSGAIKDAAVKSVRIARASDANGREKGVVGVSCLITLTYDIDEANAPQTLYIKFSSPDDKINRAWLYQNEVRFYQKLASRSGLRTPHCYYSDINVETGEHILVMEHIHTIETGDHVTGYSPEEAVQAVRSIAKFHAMWWGNSELATFDWLTEDELGRTENDFEEDWKPFVDYMGGQIPESFKTIGAHFGKNLIAAYKLHSKSPRTLLHNDYHIENLLFKDDTSLVVIDWHIIMRGRGVWDVAYNLCLSLQPTDRQTSEMSLLQLYHDILLEHGVQNYTFDDCFHDYRLAVLRPFYIFTSVVGGGAFEGEHGARVIDAIVPRLDAALSDLKVAELLSEYV